MRKIQFPRLVIPLSVVLLALVQPGAEPRRGADLRADRRRAADAQLARAAADRRDAGRVLRPASRCCCRRCSCSFRDIQPIWEVFSQILFYASPVIIPVETVREKLIARPRRSCITSTCSTRSSVVFQQFRHAMINHATLSAGEALGSWAALLGPLAIVAGGLRARLLGVQPHGPARRREPLVRGARRRLGGLLGAYAVARGAAAGGPLRRAVRAFSRAPAAAVRNRRSGVAHRLVAHRRSASAWSRSCSSTRPARRGSATPGRPAARGVDVQRKPELSAIAGRAATCRAARSGSASPKNGR